MVNSNIFLGSGTTTTLVPELLLSALIDSSESTATQLTLLPAFATNLLLVPNLYVGCKVELYDESETGNPHTVHTITANGENTIDITPAHGLTLIADDTDYVIIQPYGAPCPAKKTGANSYRLNADNWLGLVETVSFPSTEIEMKQLNLSLGGSRNFTHQYKGIHTASGGNIALVANHGAFLYYALGSCTGVKCTTTTSTSIDPADENNAHTAGAVYYDSGDEAVTAFDGSFETAHLNQGPIFYRADAASVTLLPPVVHGVDVHTNLNLLTRPTYSSGTIANPITYEFSEANGEDLPSFSLEHSMTKTTNTTVTEGTATETETVVRIARGNRVNTMTMTANENEEVKMTMDLNTRVVDHINDLTTTQVYTPRNAVSTNTALFNFDSNPEALDPFFFSSGSFSIFGQQFLKITNLTITINNNLQDKRFIGIGSKRIKSAIPAQRNYEIAFTAMVTDDKLLTELLNQTEETSADTIANGLIDITFDKASGEQIKLQFKNYLLSAATVTVPDDKGAITVEGTVMPRDLALCEVKTHWVLQG